MDWTALSQNLPALIILAMFVVATLGGFLYAAWHAFNSMLKILSAMLDESRENNREQGKDFINALKEVTEPLGAITDTLGQIKRDGEENRATLQRIEKRIESLVSGGRSGRSVFHQ